MAFDFNERISLENERVRLDPLQMEHLEVLWPIAQKHPDLLTYSPSPFGTRDLYEDYFTFAFQAKADHFRYPFIIFDKEQKTYAGSTSYGNISNKDKRLEIGWTWLGKEFQGTGLNKYCKSLLLEYAFEKLFFSRVELKTDSRNSQSRRAMEKIGAVFEGELRSHTLMNDGFRRNTVYYSILDNEWPLLKTRIFKECFP